MADYHITADEVEDVIDAIAAFQDSKLDKLMETFGEIAREAKAGRAIIIAVKDE